jgi:multiple sugar transport system permease protein
VTDNVPPPVNTGVAQVGVSAINPRAGAAQPEVRRVGDHGAHWRRRIAYVLMIAYAILMVVPFSWSVITSFKTQADAVNLSVIPQPITTEGWQYLFERLDPSLIRLSANSFGIALAVTLSNLVLASLAGYAFARLRFPGREALFIIVLATLMIPDQLRLVPVFVTLTNWHLVGTFRGYIFLKLIEATNLFFFRQYFLTIPRDFEEAAKLDGAGYFKTFWRIMLPLAGPAIAAVTILEFQGIWNDFFWPAIILGFGNPHVYTIQLGITQFIFQYGTLWPQLMAASVLAILPIALVFVVFQRYFIAGVVASGVKG